MSWSSEEDFFKKNINFTLVIPKITSQRNGGNEIYNFLYP